MRGIGLQEYQNLVRLHDSAEQMGFAFDTSPFSNDNRFVIVPLDDRWPSYSRDARIFFGDMDEVAAFLDGIKMARDYYMVHLKLFTEKRLDRKEQDIRNQQLVNRLADSGEDDKV